MMNTNILPYGVANLLGAGLGLYFIANDEYTYRTDLVVEKTYASDPVKELFYNELNTMSPLQFVSGVLYHIPTEKFYNLFRR